MPRQHSATYRQRTEDGVPPLNECRAGARQDGHPHGPVQLGEEARVGRPEALRGLRSRWASSMITTSHGRAVSAGLSGSRRAAASETITTGWSVPVSHSPLLAIVAGSANFRPSSSRHCCGGGFDQARPVGMEGSAAPQGGQERQIGRQQGGQLLRWSEISHRHAGNPMESDPALRPIAPRARFSPW